MKSYDELKALIDQRGVHAVFGEPGEGWAIEQNSGELAEFLGVCQDLGVSSILEIGTGYKAGLARFLRDDLGWRVTSVDIKDYGHQFGGIRFLTWEQVQDLDEAGGFYGLGAHDLVLIDGDHTYEAVARDHAFYAPYATMVIAFHDIAGLRECVGVEEYWDRISSGGEFSKTHDEKKPSSRIDTLKPGYYEIIADTPERGGIGYIVLSEVEAQPEAWQRPEVEIVHPEPATEPKPVPKPKTTPRKRTPAKKPATAKAVKK